MSFNFTLMVAGTGVTLLCQHSHIIEHLTGLHFYDYKLSQYLHGFFNIFIGV